MRKELYRLWLWLAAPQQLHYINGADTLPPPLPPECTARDFVLAHASPPLFGLVCPVWIDKMQRKRYHYKVYKSKEPSPCGGRWRRSAG